MSNSKENAKTKFNNWGKNILGALKKAGAFALKSRIVVMSVLVVISVIGTILFAGLTVGYSVEYNGSVIAQVREKNDYSEALNIAQGYFFDGAIEQYTATPNFSFIVTVEKNFATPQEVAVSIINETAAIKEGSALYIDGIISTCVEKEENLEGYIADYLNCYVEAENVVSSFMKDVKVVNGYYCCEKFSSMETVQQLISDIDVQSVITEKTVLEIPFKTVTRKSSSRYQGEVITAVSGSNGIREIVKETVMLNGEVVSKKVVFDEITTKPVEEVIVIGTKVETSVSDVYVSELGCIWPLKRVSGQIVTAYWGDGRNHKGIDIASPGGTPIYAAQKGTVITSTYSNSYGNYIIIDHGNGYKTVYAHAKKLLVSVGTVVNQGDMIALVGTTGQSTGNHLHFEVRKNNERLNPAPFIGL